MHKILKKNSKAHDNWIVYENFGFGKINETKLINISKNSVSSYSREIEEQKLSFSIKKFKKKDDFEKAIRETRIKMEKAAKELDFLKAASLRDEIKFLRTKKNKL